MRAGIEEQAGARADHEMRARTCNSASERKQVERTNGRTNAAQAMLETFSQPETQSVSAWP